ncbi:MAG TPA: AAA family ATPase [Candidatus Omnitrophota bacterium]|nr:AAA family ATPase [Candidatus Omnitrophota bacterium]
MYREFFGLTDEPFRITPDPRFIYFSRKHQEAFATLLYGINYRKGFIEITGEIGAGKTTLCRRLLSELNGTAKTALILNPGLSDTQLLHAIVEDFGAKPRQRNKKGYFDALNALFLDMDRQGLTSVLIIDEAQNLGAKTLEQIRLLSNLETETKKLLQIVLVGQPELRDNLRNPTLVQLRQRIMLRYHLSALDATETENYILHRLRVAGGESKIFFTPEAIRAIHESTQGVPRLINSICDKAMLAAYVKEQRTVDEQMIEVAYQEAEGMAVPA